MINNHTLNLTTDIKYLKGVGPQRASILYQNNINTIINTTKAIPLPNDRAAQVRQHVFDRDRPDGV